MLDTREIVVTVFSMTDKANQVRFLEKIFLVANISPKVVFEMHFLILSGVNIDFLGREFQWRTYTTEEALPTTRHIELVSKKKFAFAALDPESETFVIHVASLSYVMLLSFSPFDVHPSHRSQIAGLISKEAFTKVPSKYIDFTDVFSLDLEFKFPEHTRIKTAVSNWLMVKNHLMDLFIT